MQPFSLCLGLILLLSPVPVWAEEDDKPSASFPYTLAELEERIDASPQIRRTAGEGAGQRLFVVFAVAQDERAGEANLICQATARRSQAPLRLRADDAIDRQPVEALVASTALAVSSPQEPRFYRIRHYRG